MYDSLKLTKSWSGGCEIDFNKWSLRSKGKEDNNPSNAQADRNEELERIRKELEKRGMDSNISEEDKKQASTGKEVEKIGIDSNVSNEDAHQVSTKNVIDQELKTIIEEEIQNAAKELVDELKIAIRSLVEEHKQIISDVLEQEKLSIRANKENITQSIIRLGLG